MEQLKIKVLYCINESIEEVNFRIRIINSEGLRCYETSTKVDKYDELNIQKDGSFEIQFNNIELLPDTFQVDIVIESKSGEVIDCFIKSCNFTTFTDVTDSGVCRLQHKWNV